MSYFAASGRCNSSTQVQKAEEFVEASGAGEDLRKYRDAICRSGLTRNPQVSGFAAATTH
jgi:hypothetical protein